MAMGRSSMGKQIATSRGSKPKKMSNGGLAMISPAAALVQSIQSGQPEGLLKLSPLAQIASAGRKKKPEEMAASAAQPAPMAKGGKVRGDGCATRGKTKGMMR